MPDMSYAAMHVTHIPHIPDMPYTYQTWRACATDKGSRAMLGDGVPTLCCMLTAVHTPCLAGTGSCFSKADPESKEELVGGLIDRETFLDKVGVT